MRNLDNDLKSRIIDYNKLVEYGFEKDNEEYIYKTKIYENQFEMIVKISKKQNVSRLIDVINEEEYILVDVEGTIGEFVGKVRTEYENNLQDIIEKCTRFSAFNSNQAIEVIKYVKEKYNDELEFLWKKFDNNAIWRNNTNQKWYGVMLTISESKLGIESEKNIEIIDLRFQKDKIAEIIDKNEIFPGWHMNKDSWITLKLDGSVDIHKIFELIDNSYELSLGVSSELGSKVLEYLLTIPKGKVVTYGQIAKTLGNKGYARAVGNILHNNPDGDKYPCYKVLNSKGELAKAFVFGGKNVQKERLEKDGIEVVDNKVDLLIYQWDGKN